MTVDGQSALIVRTNGVVQGVRIPPGEHRVRLRFQPRGFWWGVLAATVALAGLGILAFPRRVSRALLEEAEEKASDR